MLRVIFGIFLFPTLALAWGGRGHDAICVAASFLVKEPALQDFLKSRSPVMGALCNIPDTYWRSLPGDVNRVGAPTHFMDPEIVGLKINEVPTDLDSLIEKYTGSENKIKPGNKILSVPEEFGSLWWRADQFFRRISGLDFKSAAPPQDKKQEQDDGLPFNQKVFQMYVDMGLMGHYVGDAGQPFHGTADYDGYGTGHGGIHGYFEGEVVAEFGPDLAEEIRKKAAGMKAATWLKPRSTVEKMRALSVIAAGDIDKILKLDVLTKPSEFKREKGMELKTAAIRPSAQKTFKKFRALAIEDMARSSALLAQLWDEAYRNAGKPDLSLYRSYKFPFMPEFVKPDYVKEPPAKK